MSENNQSGNITNILPGQTSAAADASGSPAAKPVRLRQRHGVTADRKADVRYLAVVLAVLFVGFLLITRYAVTINKPTIGSHQARESSSLYYALRIENRNPDTRGPVGLQFSVYNKSGHTIALGFEPGPKFDFIAQKRVNLFFFDVPLEVWRYSKRNNKFVTDEPDSIDIMPGEEKVFRGEWDLKDSDGIDVDPANYTLTGYINTVGGSHALEVRKD